MSAPVRIAWEQFTLDPRRRDNAAMRASDKDRDVALAALGEAFADGRLDRAEFDERSSAAQQAKHLGDLVAPLADLAAPDTAPVPAPRVRRPVAPTPSSRHPFAGLWVFWVPTVVCWVIWLHASLGSGGFDPQFPWPLFVMLGTSGMAFGRGPCGSARTHGRSERRLERPGT